MKKITTLTIATAFFLAASISCNSKGEYTEKKENAEIEGQKCLVSARKSLEDKDFETARTTIEKMHKDYPLALKAREAGILLLDSINLFEAETQLKKINELLKDENHPKYDSLQVEFDDLFQKNKFYKRKLEHDKQEYKAR